MAYIGKQPATVALTSDDLEDNIVTSSKLNNDIISGQTALAEAPADADELLISDAGTLKRMDYSHIKASSDFVKLSSGTMSSADTLTFDSLDTSTYRAFRIILSDVVCLANYTQLRGRFRYDNSGTQADRSDSNYWTQTQGHRTGPAGSGTRSVIDYSANSYFQLNELLTQYDRPSTQCFDIVLYDIANTDGHKSIQINSSGGQDTTGTDYYFYFHGNGFYRNTGANNGFTIYTANSDNFTGNYAIYGIK